MKNYFRIKKSAFTLAEVLITLGIIGVVAALTIPTLISNHQKNVAETRLKKFASVWRQAAINVYHDKGTWSFTEPNSSYTSATELAYYNDSFGKYIKTLDVIEEEPGIFAAMPDGSGFFLYNTGTYLIFCPDYKYCKNNFNFSRASGLPAEWIVDGKNTFAFYGSRGNTPTYEWDGSRDWLKRQCTSGRKGYCSTLIEFDGWEISDDYPAW